MGPLQGVRVLDLSRILAGPWATQLLADLGAEVIKVERPGSGDDTRRWGPPFLRDKAGQPTSESAYYLASNRGKQSICIDFTTAEGAQLVRDLAAQSQIVVENFKQGGLAPYGLDWPSLQALNPALVYCSITGYGQTGPNAQRAGYDAAIQAEAGLMSLTGEADGGPQKVGVAVVDLMTGMYAVVGILAALRHAQASGVGQQIDLALFDTQVGWLANQAMNYLVGGNVPQRQGTAHPNIVPYQVMSASDGHFMLAVGNDGQFQRLCESMAAAELATDPRYASNAARVDNRAGLVAELSAILQGNTVKYWLDRLAAATVPCGPVNALDAVFAHDQVQARGLVFELPHPLAGAIPMVANPLNFSHTPVQYVHAPPLLGADTDSVLQTCLGLELVHLARLRSAGVIG
jgi:crotonobetainyl-CoA:carnitine CoA-transferase CaiB-like acyl-CoA transferase